MSNTFEGRARNLSTDGSAVVESLADGRIFFVEGAWPGDEGLFEILSFEKRFGYARLLELRKRSPDRMDVPCPHQGFGTGFCGGCPWMLGTYESQLHHKTHRVDYALRRAGLLGLGHVETIAPIWASPEVFGYRNRAQFKTDGEKLGFVSLSTTDIVDVGVCAVLNPRMQKNLTSLRQTLPRAEWKPKSGHGWVFVDIDDEVSLDARADVERLELNQRRPFKQGNTAQNFRMREWLRQKIQGLNAAAIELYCGSGNFTEVLIEEGCPRLLAVEVAEVALAKLRSMHPSANLETLTFNLASPRDFSDFAARIAKMRPEEFRILLLDPPREGAKGVEHLLPGLPKLDRILMVSCDVATFTRDASALAKQGYRLREVQPLDLFPHTSHVELLADFERT